MATADEPWEIAGDMSRNGYRILLAIQTAGGEVRTATIRETTGLSNSLVNYYLTASNNTNNFTQLGLVERIEDKNEAEGDQLDQGLGQKQGQARGLDLPRDGYLYRLTERGRDTLAAAQEDYDLDPIEEGEIRRRFDDLEDRMEQVEKRLDRISSDLAQNIEDLEMVGGAVKELIEDIEDVYDN